MRRNITALIAFSLLAAPAAGFAQVRTRPATPPRPAAPTAAAEARQMPVPGVEIAEHILAYRDELGLTAAQVTRIRALRDAHIAKIRPLTEQLRAERPETPEERLQQLRQQDNRTEQQIQSMRERMQQQRARGQVTAEQREQMKLRADSLRTRQDSIRARVRSLTDEQRAAARGTARERVQRAEPAMNPELRAKMEELRESNRLFVEEINAVLTPEQREKLRTLRPARGGR